MYRWFILLCLFFPLLTQADAPGDVIDGARLYARHCAACHGMRGDGGVGVPLRLPDFQAGVSDAYFERTIRLGRPGRVMPAFRDLDDVEVSAIIRHVRSWAVTDAPPHDATPVRGDVKRGAGLFAKHCAVCHGAQGEGGAGTGVTFSRPRDLPVIAPALNNPGFLTAASDRMIRDTVARGRAGTPMVSFREQGFSEQDLDDVVAYVRGFGERPYDVPIDASDEPATLVFDSPHDLVTTVEALVRAAEGRNFRHIRTQTLEEGLWPEGEDDPHQVVVYFCNFEFLNRALQVDPRVGLFLPCRVTAVERDGRVQVLAINPKRLSSHYNNRELNRMCEEMYGLYVAIIEEATL